MLSEVLLALSENKSASILSMGLSLRFGSDRLVGIRSVGMSRNGDSHDIRLNPRVSLTGPSQAILSGLLLSGGCGCCMLVVCSLLTERFVQLRLSVFFFRLFTIVVWDVLSLRGDDPCLPEQKRAYYSWDIHSWLTFVKSRQIVPKTCFDRKARFDQSAGRFGNRWKMTGVLTLSSHRSDP